MDHVSLVCIVFVDVSKCTHIHIHIMLVDGLIVLTVGWNNFLGSRSGLKFTSSIKYIIGPPDSTLKYVSSQKKTDELGE